MPIPEMKFKPFDPSEPVEIRLLKEKVEALPDSYYRDFFRSETFKNMEMVVSNPDHDCPICKMLGKSKDEVELPVFAHDQNPEVDVAKYRIKLHPEHPLYEMAKSGDLKCLHLNENSLQEA